MPIPLSRRRYGVGGALAALLALALCLPAAAADLGFPPYGGPEDGPGEAEPFDRLPPPRPHFAAGPPPWAFAGPPPAACRTVVRHRFDEDGEPVLRRIRICDEPDAPHPRFRPSFHRPPLPPGEIPGAPWDGPPPRW